MIGFYLEIQKNLQNSVQTMKIFCKVPQPYMCKIKNQFEYIMEEKILFTIGKRK